MYAHISFLETRTSLLHSLLWLPVHYRFKNKGLHSFLWLPVHCKIKTKVFSLSFIGCIIPSQNNCLTSSVFSVLFNSICTFLLKFQVYQCNKTKMQWLIVFLISRSYHLDQIVFELIVSHTIISF